MGRHPEPGKGHESVGGTPRTEVPPSGADELEQAAEEEAGKTVAEGSVSVQHNHHFLQLQP